jgi:hypothetical protein
MLLAEVARLKAQLQLNIANTKSNSSPSTSDKLINRPSGVHGQKYNLGKYLANEHNVTKPQYNRMMVSSSYHNRQRLPLNVKTVTRYTLKAARLGGRFAQQDHVKMGQVFAEVCSTLIRFSI